MTKVQILTAVFIAHVLVVGTVATVLALFTSLPWWAVLLIVWPVSLVFIHRARRVYPNVGI